MHKLVLAIGLFTLSATNAVAQGAGKTQAQLSATYDAHKGDFDYLLGTWAFTFENQDYGKGQGTWRIIRLPEGQLLDEFRVVDDSGRTMFMTITLRAYNASLNLWELVGMHRGDGLENHGTGRRVGNEVHITQRTGTENGVSVMLQIRYYDISAERFSWIADKSMDGGKTWQLGFARIEARRVGPAHN